MSDTTHAPAASTRFVPVWLLGLTWLMFTFSTDDYVIAGVLPELAADLHVSEAAAGQLVTVFALTCAPVSPIAAVATATWRRRPLLGLALLVFIAANLTAPLVGGYPALVALRVAAAAAAATVIPAAFSIAAACAPEGRQGRYLGLITTGLTASIALGVPIGTWTAAAAGWRAVFVLGAAFGVLALGVLWRTLPEPPAARAMPLRERLAALRRPALLAGLLAGTAAVGGNMILQTYLAPFLRELSGVGPATLGAVFVALGVAGLAGAQLGGRASDRWGPGTALLIGCGGFALVMGGIAVLWTARPTALWTVLPLLMAWSVLAWWIPTPTAARLLALAGPAGPQAMALNSSAVYAGVAGGGALGGVLLGGYGGGALPIAAALAALLAIALFRFADRLA